MDDFRTWMNLLESTFENEDVDLDDHINKDAPMTFDQLETKWHEAGAPTSRDKLVAFLKDQGFEDSAINQVLSIDGDDSETLSRSTINSITVLANMCLNAGIQKEALELATAQLAAVSNQLKPLTRGSIRA